MRDTIEALEELLTTLPAHSDGWYAVGAAISELRQWRSESCDVAAPPAPQGDK